MKDQAVLKIGCQTFTWEMLGDRWTGSVDDILDAMADAGYTGIEITNVMIGDYLDRPKDFAEALKRRGLTLAAYAFGASTGFTDPDHRAAELAGADKAMAFALQFPGTILALGSADITGKGSEADQLKRGADFYNEVGRRGKARGIEVGFHPSTHEGSILVSRAQYDQMMAHTDPALVRWISDTGHIVRGGQDLRSTLEDYADRICHVHLKDVDAEGNWQAMGDGVCDMPATIRFLRDELKFDRWYVLEEECAAAWNDPAGAVKANKRYLDGLGL